MDDKIKEVMGLVVEYGDVREIHNDGAPDELKSIESKLRELASEDGGVTANDGSVIWVTVNIGNKKSRFGMSKFAFDQAIDQEGVAGHHLLSTIKLMESQ